MLKKIKELVVDDKLLELRPINLYFVSRYRQAVRSGSVFPPPIVEKGTNRIVSGNHRVRMYAEEFGPDHKIKVCEMNFSDEAEVIRKFAEENSTHGNALSGLSQKAITQALLRHGDSPETIARALNIPVKRVEMLGNMQVVVIGSHNKREYRPVKRSLDHMTGPIKKVEYEEHIKKDYGIFSATIASQLIRHLKNGWIDLSNKHILNKMTELRNVLNDALDIPDAISSK